MPVYYQSERVTIYHGDCLSIVRALEMATVDAVISDPPYGMKWDTNGTRFTGGNRDLREGRGRDDFDPVAGDRQTFDPAPWLDYPRVVLWGSNHFGRSLPTGTTLIWAKKLPHQYGTFLSDGEVGWMKGGHGVYIHQDTSMLGMTGDRTRPNRRVHPTQKPVGLMAWAMEKAKVPTDGLVLDPYAGSGTTAIAALRTGRRCVLIECEERYCEAAARRVEREEAQQDLFPAV